jgi:hypothetical protein
LLEFYFVFFLQVSGYILKKRRALYLDYFVGVMAALAKDLWTELVAMVFAKPVRFDLYLKQNWLVRPMIAQ